MNENARKWVEALRSGEYTQTTGQLRHGDGYCCLGVACDVYRRETGRGKWQCETGSESYAFDLGSDELSAADVLPKRVSYWLGVREAEGGFRDGSLIDENDTGEDFEHIAEIIESEPEGLFT